MQIVIDIPEDRYARICNHTEKTSDPLSVLIAVENGIPLQKGHGRMIDADELRSIFQKRHDSFVNAYGGFQNMPRNDKARVDEITSNIADVVSAPTIIEADKEDL